VECELRAKLCFCILRLWLWSSTFPERYVGFFYVQKVVPVDTDLVSTWTFAILLWVGNFKMGLQLYYDGFAILLWVCILTSRVPTLT
jgi:hypothetical protein